ncbi:hypothetical protein DDD_3114 [Nonlabens dokdonensis DSW-6]|uniref:Uncharacterized protein n=1 Tax=Nonlabens dokdonensis (strain DSM 17205 / KCTC 12402 / DSW-6) TaxID=592029 RepID=L7WE75_NONDD|nr:hypothetical protein DDD_3114 [Nonlabens dokdonensis DSW-6]
MARQLLLEESFGKARVIFTKSTLSRKREYNNTFNLHHVII